MLYAGETKQKQQNMSQALLHVGKENQKAQNTKTKAQGIWIQ